MVTTAGARHREGRRLAPLVLLAALLAPSAASARLRLNIGGADFRPLPVAVMAVEAKAPAGQASAEALTRVLRADADLARSLQLVPPNTYLAAGEAWDQPILPAWRDVGAAGLVQGRLALQQAEAEVRLRFWDVATGREVVSHTCRQDVRRLQICAHRFWDAVIAELTGEAGIFSSRIAFVRKDGAGKSLVACDVDGQAPVALTTGGALDLLPSWDPRGQFLLFTSFRGGNPDLYRLPLDGSPPQPLSRHRGLNMGGAVAPDGGRVALTLSERGNTQIFSMRPDGRDLRQLTHSGGQNLSPTWSPDGRRLAFVSSRSGAPHLFVMDADGGHPRRLTYRGTYNQEPEWSPRPGGQIAFTARDEHYKYDIFLVHPDDGRLTRLTEDAGHNQSPSFAPDGQTLVFTSTRGSSGTPRLWTMDVNGGRQREIPLPAGAFETPAWGPRLAAP